MHLTNFSHDKVLCLMRSMGRLETGPYTNLALTEWSTSQIVNTSMVWRFHYWKTSICRIFQPPLWTCTTLQNMIWKAVLTRFVSREFPLNLLSKVTILCCSKWTEGVSWKKFVRKDVGVNIFRSIEKLIKVQKKASECEDNKMQSWCVIGKEKSCS